METVAPESAATLLVPTADVIVPSGSIIVIYQKKDISAAIAPYLTDVHYTDHMGGQADSVELTLEDADGRWMDAWYPTFGDTLTVSIGYAGQPLLPCGTFDIDEITLDGPPDTVCIKALGAGVKKAVRSRTARAYENVTLATIAATVAKRNKLKLAGKIEPIQITRVTQAYETDLVFLKRISIEYGYEFSIRGGLMTFYKRSALKAAQHVLVIGRSDLTKYSFRDKVHEIYLASTVTWHDPHAKHVRKKRVADPSSKLSAYDHYSADELNLNVRAETDSQANAKAQSALERANDDQTGATLTLYGNTKLAAGVNILVKDFGKLSGKYFISQSKHEFSRGSGYSTEIELKRVRDAANGA
ncbi:Cro/Cl family transcriptional regulator [Burkholderia sp. Ac-20345]|uniref:phage late control D family protein n=1 Tax=Burkholderia sp. Ac-20345 TaxID=2703891 RepID=UPI00197BF581|nr:Cro/Cl family transcriptional regulator [Burkholderia sp. Ac-20345]MBN3779914.1 Cro/Cl family transcriptional regulator [Burkholderia sp. Ac-20345]